MINPLISNIQKIFKKKILITTNRPKIFFYLSDNFFFIYGFMNGVTELYYALPLNFKNY